MNNRSEYYRARRAAMSPEELERERACRRMKAKFFWESHRDEINAKKRERYASNPEVREQSRAYYYNVVKPKRQATSVAKAIERLTAMGYTVIRPTEEGNA